MSAITDVIMTPTGPVAPRDECDAIGHGRGRLVTAGDEQAVMFIGGVVAVCPVGSLRAIVDTQA